MEKIYIRKTLLTSSKREKNKRKSEKLRFKKIQSENPKKNRRRKFSIKNKSKTRIILNFKNKRNLFFYNNNNLKLTILYSIILISVTTIAFQLPLSPIRQVPPDTIVLENGSTTFASTLEEYLLTSTTTTTSNNSIERDEEENFKRDYNFQEGGIINKTNNIKQFENDNNNKTFISEVSNSKLVFKLYEIEKESSRSLANKSSEQHQQHQINSKTITNNNNEENNKTKSGIEIEFNGNSAATVGVAEPTGSSHLMSETNNNNKNTTVKPIPQHWQVKSLLNVTQDYPLAYSQIICGYVWPLMALITCFTNLMIVFVLTQKDMRTPTNVVLTSIAIADIIPIVVPVPWFVYLFAMGNEKQVLYPPVICYIYQHSTRSVSEIFYFLSTWLNVLLAIQDYLTACKPKLAKYWCQIKVVIWEIILLTLLAFLVNLPQLLKLVFKPIKFYYQGELVWGCRALQAKWFKDLIGEYVALYDDIFTAVIVLFVDGGPAIALITLTALLIRQLHKQRIKGHLLMEQARTASKRRLERYRQQEYESSARVMIFVLLAFLAVKIPFATTYTLMIIQSRFEIHFVENLVDFQKAISITDLVFVLSYPINFTIFCCCSKKFRHKCIQLFGECNQNTKEAKNRFMGSFSGSFQYSNADGNSILSKLSRRTSAQTIARNGSIATASSMQQIFSTASSIGNRNVNYQTNQQQQQHQQQQQQQQQQLINNNNNLLQNYRSLATIEGSTENNSLATNANTNTNTFSDSIISCEKRSDNFFKLDNNEQHQKQALDYYYKNNYCKDKNHFVIDDFRSTKLIDCKQTNNNFTLSDQSDKINSKLQKSLNNSMPKEFKAQLEDGSLCLECIMRYEQIKRLSTVSMSSNYEQQQQQQQQQQRLNEIITNARRQSNDSDASWPIQPPPPPELNISTKQIEQFKQQLPHIITTECDSIREQDSFEQDREIEERERQKQQLQESSEPSSISSFANANKNDYNYDTEQRKQIKTDASHEGEEDADFRKDMKEAKSRIENSNFIYKRQKQIDETTLRLARLLNDNNNNNNKNDKNLLANNKSLTLRGNSDPGNGSSSLLEGLRNNLSSFIRRASGNSYNTASEEESTVIETERKNINDYREGGREDDDEFDKKQIDSGEVNLEHERDKFHKTKTTREEEEEDKKNYNLIKNKKNKYYHRLSSISAPSKSSSKKNLKGSKGCLLVETQKRSLSMSDSKITTLPNATGLLADIMLSTLLNTNSNQDRINMSDDNNNDDKSPASNRRTKKMIMKKKKKKKKKDDEEQENENFNNNNKSPSEEGQLEHQFQSEAKQLETATDQYQQLQKKQEKQQQQRQRRGSLTRWGGHSQYQYKHHES